MGGYDYENYLRGPSGPESHEHVSRRRVSISEYIQGLINPGCRNW